jgi:hypothetical protein
MAKVNRKMLKNIVKECLVEILAEGISGGDVEELNESFEEAKPRLMPRLNEQKSRPSKKKQANNKFEENTQRAISKATNDPIMAELLADTAKTTLQEQNGADSPGKFTAKGSDTYSKIVESNDPMELFGNSSSNWAHLAFADNKK